MADWLHAAAAVMLGVAVTWRVQMLRGSMTSRTLWIALTLLGLCQALQVNGVYRAVEQGTGLPGSAAMVVHVLTVIAAAAVREFHHSLDAAREPGLDRRSLALAALSLTVMIGVYSVFPPAAVHPALSGRSEYYDGTAATAVVWTAYLAYLSWALLGGFTLTRRFARQAEPGPTRTGLRVGAVGLGVGFGYVALKVVVVGGWVIGAGPVLVRGDEVGEAVVLTCSLVLICAGSTAEALAAAGASARSTVRSRLALYRLRRLRSRLESGDSTADYRLPAATDRQRLILLVTGIRDAQRTLRRFVSPEVLADAQRAAENAGHPCDRAELLAEAAGLELARRARTQGLRPLPSTPSHQLGGEDLEAEIRHLEQLAVVYDDDFVRAYATTTMAQ